jgi:hypothetical protein
MALYRITENDLEPVHTDSMANLGIREREDLQRVLRENIGAVAPGTLVISEEFSEWEESRRRVDLLGIDPDGCVVVIELKRTQDGGHMELQALRYAAMVSALTFDRVVEILAIHLEATGKSGEAERILLAHLGWESAADGEIAERVRMVLVAGDFSQEITTTVLWLNGQGLDIRCVKISSYKHGGEILLDIEQVIPLPEAADYMVRLRQKEVEKRVTRLRTTRDLTYFDVTLAGRTEIRLAKRRAIYAIARHLVEQGISPDEIQAALPAGQMQRFYGIEGLWTTQEDFCEEALRQAIPTITGKPFLPAPWLVKDDELIHHGGRTYAFSKMWGPRTEACMAALKAAYPAMGIGFTVSKE